MAKRYRGRQRMVSESIFNSPDFWDFTALERLIYVGLVILSDDQGRVCIDEQWLKHRLCMQQGMGRSNTRWIRRCIERCIDRRILQRIDRPSTQHAPLSYGQLTNFTAHNRIPRPETKPNQDEEREDQTSGLGDDSSSGMPRVKWAGSGQNGTGLCTVQVSLKKIRKEDLQSAERTAQLHDEAAKEGWFVPSDRTQFSVQAMAVSCLRLGRKNPMGMFRRRLENREWSRASEVDEREARKRLQRLHAV